MTNEELKNALMKGVEVEYEGIIYKRVSAIIYRMVEGKIVVLAEIEDKNAKSSLIVASATKLKGVKND